MRWAGIKGRIKLLIREHGLLLRVVIGAVAFLFVAFFLWQLVAPRTPEQRTAFIQTMGGIVGGSALLFGLYFTARNLQVSQEGQITERFTRAIDQLGSDKIEIRLGGIYALERIARDSERDHWSIMEVLTAYVRQHARWRPEDVQQAEEDAAVEKKSEEDSSGESETTEASAADIQAIVTVIRRRTRSFGHGEPEPLDLHGTNLSGAGLGKANLSRASFREANLSGAYLSRANLSRAILRKANLSAEANLSEADLSDANLSGANFSGASFWKAKLSGANFSRANLSRASFREANLSRAHLWEANLSGAKLSRAILTQAQLENTTGDEHTQLPRDLEHPAHWNVKTDEQIEGD